MPLLVAQPWLLLYSSQYANVTMQQRTARSHAQMHRVHTLARTQQGFKK